MPIEKGPTWDAGLKMPSFPTLKSSIDVEVAIIGGGITGITSAYLLSMKGKKVALLEKTNLCSGATGVTTAFLTQNIDTDWKKLAKMYGKKEASLIAKSHQEAINKIEKIVKKNKIDCEFIRCSNYSYAINEKESESLQEEEKVAKGIGLKIVFKKDNSLGFPNYGYLELSNQGKFHPLKYLSALSKLAQKEGAMIFEKTEVKKIEGTGPYVLITPSGAIRANQVIIATYAPFNKKLFFKKAFYTSYVFEIQMPSKILKEGIYEDTLDPYHYFRVDRKGKYDRVIIGGEDHRSDIPVNKTKNFRALADYVKKVFGHIEYKIVRKWYGPIVEPVDGLAYIGEHKEKNIFYATGFSGNGMTYGTIASQIITNQILGNKDPEVKQFSRIYDAKRIPTPRQLSSKGVDYTRELYHGAIKNTLRKKRS